jgi:hypothetical protein
MHRNATGGQTLNFQNKHSDDICGRYRPKQKIAPRVKSRRNYITVHVLRSASTKTVCDTVKQQLHQCCTLQTILQHDECDRVEGLKCCNLQYWIRLERNVSKQTCKQISGDPNFASSKPEMSTYGIKEWLWSHETGVLNKRKIGYSLIVYAYIYYLEHSD